MLSLKRNYKIKKSFIPKSNFISKRNYWEPHFQRNESFSKLNEDDIKHFKSILGENGVVVDPVEVEPFNVDWMRKYKGNSSLVLRPKTTHQVSEILKHCNSRKLAVVPQGGNTGLVGGSVPVFDEIIISTTFMNNIINFDPVAGIVICQAGVVLGKLDSYLSERGHTVPLDLGAKGSCQIGGNVATNAGGVRLLRYGSLHGNVLGLEVVLANGNILDTLTTLRKDNTGYDLKQLFIGSEGTLGIITGVSILTPPKPNSVSVCLLGLESFDKVRETYFRTKKELAEVLSAFEFLDRPSMDMVLKHIQGSRDPFSGSYPFYVLIETSGSNEAHDKQKLEKLLDILFEESVILDGSISQTGVQNEELWKLRESISPALGHAGTVYKYDVSLPLERFYELVEIMRSRVADKGVTVGYGHVGDGNLHLNISTPNFRQDVLDLIEPFVYEFTSKYRGSISAEHGIGVMKPKELHFSKTKESIEIMKVLKKSLDPQGILNPYKVIPRE